MKIKLIINPNAGIQKRKLSMIRKKFFGKENDTHNEIIKFFEKKGHSVSISTTKKALDGTKIAAKSKNFDAVIAVGGDGTINEVINGLKGYKGKFGIIPIGSTNATAQELGIPMNINKACECIDSGKTVKIDVGTINNKRFILVAGIGFDAHAITNVKFGLKKLIGKHAYIVSGFQILFKHKPQELTIKIGRKTQKGYFAIATNMKKYGGAVEVAPNAKTNDGYLELCIFKNKNVWGVMKYLAGAAKGSVANVEGMVCYKIKTATITAKEKVLFHGDGEVGGTTPVKIKVLPRELNIIVP